MTLVGSHVLTERRRRASLEAWVKARHPACLDVVMKDGYVGICATRLTADGGTARVLASIPVLILLSNRRGWRFDLAWRLWELRRVIHNHLRAARRAAPAPHLRIIK